MGMKGIGGQEKGLHNPREGNTVSERVACKEEGSPMPRF